jgi:hypothetical protein
MSRALPAGTLERFTAAIQPMLVNRCGANNCHGSAEDTGFRLLRLSLGGSATRRYTLRNLHATLRHVDREAPDESVLLSMATRPHGSATAAPLPAQDSSQATLLRTWVQLAARSRTPSLPAKIAAGDGRPLQSMPASPSEPPRSNPPASVRNSSDSEPVESTSVARDPFDPEIFNRRYGPAKTP